MPSHPSYIRAPEMELRRRLVTFPRRLIINQDHSRWVEATIDSGLGAQFATRAGAFRSGPLRKRAPGPPRAARQPPAALRRPGRRHLYPRRVRPSPSWPALLGGLAGRGCSIPLPCPAVSCPAPLGPSRPGHGALPPPGYQARGGAGPARPAPAVEGARRVLLAVIPARAFYLGAAGEAGGGDTGGGP
ncbi:unnamed protein product [Nyctereutes procyonoides]|uniref:(raccoon dog) hypothetical protein n=1 Tax=Nyctereutes procyonoides TaxID=34880 RepID=A0A811YWQ9_NYCPR|nr:unnamed protein product [Nyctereutes procyonoides]